MELYFLYIMMVIGFLAWMLLFIAAISSVNFSKELSNSQKRNWLLVFFFVPIFGILFYLLFHKKRKDLSETL